MSNTLRPWGREQASRSRMATPGGGNASGQRARAGNAAKSWECSQPPCLLLACLLPFTPQAQISAPPHYTAPTSSLCLVISSAGGNCRAVIAWLCNGEELQWSIPGVKP